MGCNTRVLKHVSWVEGRCLAYFAQGTFLAQALHSCLAPARAAAGVWAPKLQSGSCFHHGRQQGKPCWSLATAEGKAATGAFSWEDLRHRTWFSSVFQVCWMSRRTARQQGSGWFLTCVTVVPGVVWWVLSCRFYSCHFFGFCFKYWKSHPEHWVRALRTQVFKFEIGLCTLNE